MEIFLFQVSGVRGLGSGVRNQVPGVEGQGGGLREEDQKI